jgi:enamine deaminase RidA (YjgF/YER057c/UK114 family)
MPALLFSGSLTPHDPVTGEVVIATGGLPARAVVGSYGSPMLDVPFDRARAQAWVVLQALQDWLDAHGSGVDRLVRLRFLVRDLRDWPAVAAIATERLRGWRPATSVVQMASGSVDPGIAVAVDAVAVASAEPAPQRLGGDGPGDLDVVRAGELLFVGAIAGLARTGEASRGTALGARSAQDIDVEAASESIFERLAGTLDALGGSLRDVVKINGWLTFPMREYRPLAEVRSRLATSAGLRPASGAIQVAALRPEGALLSFEAVAVAAGSRARTAAVSQMSDIYANAAWGGGYVWTSGEVPVDYAPARVITSAAELHPDDRQAVRGGLVAAPRSELQAHAVYRKLGSHLAELGATLEDVVHQTVFLRASGDLRGVERAAITHLGSPLPPTSWVPVCDVSPFSDSEVEIELVARSGAEQR